MNKTVTKRILVDLLAVSILSSTFTAVPSVSAEELSKRELAVQPFECDWLARPRKFYPKGRTVTGTIYLLTGAQTVQKYRPHTGTAWVTYDVTKAATVRAGNETVTFDKRDINSYGEMYDRDETYNNTLMFFMPR